MRYQAVIFDLDGVLCHTDHYHYLAWKKVANELNVYFDEKINNRLRGISRMESLEIVLELYPKQLSEVEKNHYAQMKNDYYLELLQSMSPETVTEDVTNTLNEIKNKDTIMAIGSSSKNAKFILKRIGLIDYFAAISDGNNIIHSKPHPEVFLKASEYIGVKPNNCLVVEDASAGIEAAISAKMDCAAIGDGKSNLSATYKLNCLSELLEILY
ncbi:beta-phosphoglucomutase [Alkalibaculum sp. M08DMB]|uniref:Beta-phosphoglucomutase n=1 Tax=Alkalibaculum sporogenes TaxID=2655001 RepID=A0A6A7K4Y3_9FIRM|nr:beta-phosphoglucomutase [Alkalibaculum sporogenes]MPW24440.1 beta-phosphoglucomutase [Alkalibaculum sporogenes]